MLLVDDHEVSRAACRALLRTEGLDVVADTRVGEESINAAAQLHPDAVIVDVGPDDDRGLELARRLRALKRAPTVLLTSSAPRAAFGTRLATFAFVAKADLCAGEVLTILLAHRASTDRSAGSSSG